MGRATLLTEFSQTTYYEVCKKENQHNPKLHRLYFQGLVENVAWISEKFPTYKPQDKMNLFDIAQALGLVNDELNSIEGFTYTKDTPVSIVRYFIREKKLKSQKLEDVAEYLLLRDIRGNIDLDEFIEMEKRVKNN